MSGCWIDYSDQSVPLRGWLSTPAGGSGPGVVVVHTFRGLQDRIRHRADRLATMGYVAFALDVFGMDADGAPVLPATHDAGLGVIKPFTADRAMFRRRLRAGLDALLAQPACTGRAAAIGYCFGGAGVLEMARDGQPLAGVVSLHGELSTALPALPGAVGAKVLVLHGDADPVVTPAALSQFMDEMRAAGADWEIDMYAGAEHSFTGEGLGPDPDPTAEYNAQAETRSWARQADFLAEVLGPGKKAEAAS